MTIRSYSSISMPDLPLEIPYMILDYLDLHGLLTIERTCRTLFETSISNKSAWQRIANEKKIPNDSSTFIRAQVLHSTIAYCKAARIIFPKHLANLPTLINSAYERVFIDETLKGLDKSSINPMKSIIRFLESPHGTFGKLDLHNPIEKTPLLIPRINAMTTICIGLFQVGIETGVPLNFDAAFLESLEASDFSYGSNMITKLFKQLHTTKTLCKHYSPASRDQNLDFINKMETLNEAALPFIHYLFQLSGEPSLDLLLPYLKSCAYSELIKALAPMKVKLYEKRAIHVPLLKNLSGNEWVKAFEKFMIDESVDLTLKIQYPKQLQDIFNRFDNETKDACINSMLLERLPSCCAREYYILNKINTSIEQSLRGIHLIENSIL